MRLLLLALAASGCSFLFDPSGLVSAPSSDLAASLDQQFSVDDLGVPPDLAVLLDSATPADLTAVDLRPCVPPVFVGFFDGGSPNPLDCNGCGCELDPLSNPATFAVKFNHVVPAAGWSESYDGGLTVSAPMALYGEDDYFQSQNHFYLAGDFDLQLDYQVQNLPQVAYAQLVVIGPQVDLGGSNLPVGVAEIYATTNGYHFALVTDDRSFDVITSVTSGTLRLRRVGGQLCASSVGGDELCHAGTSNAHVWLQVATPVYCATGCAGTSCCNYRVRLSRLRLLHGQVVASP